MILTVGNLKGGTGKTTLALNLAIARALAGADVLLIDADSQRSALDFTNIRAGQLGAPGYTAVALDGADMRAQVRQLAPKYDEVIIDAGGRDSPSLRASLLVSDRVLIPVQPRSLDLWAAEQTSQLVNDARVLNPDLEAYAVINAADPQGLDNEQAADYLRELKDIHLLDVSIGRRKVFGNAIALGRSVLDLTGRDRDPKAIVEINALVDALYATAGIGG